MNLATKKVAGVTVTYRPGTSDEQVIRDVFDQQYHVPPPECQPTSILDLGANIGLTMLHYRMLYPDAVIFGVEMDAENVVVARRNTADDVICAAVGPCEGIASYPAAAEPWAFSFVGWKKDDQPARQTAGVTLEMLTGYLNQDIDLLKMDIEGAESTTLMFPQKLARVRAIMVETHGDYTKQDACKHLRRAGFETNPALRHERAVYAWRPS